MKKHFYVCDKDNSDVVNNLATECISCYAQCTSPGIVISKCPKYGDRRRQGNISNTKGISFLCCNETKTTKLFREKLESLSYSSYELKLFREELVKEAKVAEQHKVNRLVHNLTSINAHNIQEIYDLVPQELLTSNYQRQLDYIQSEIRKDIRKASLMFLRIAKHNLHMKSEFSIYKKLDREDAALEPRNHPIQKVILNILHTFFSDFNDNGIYVEVEEYLQRVYIDYESIQVALYHLIENATKYAKPYTTIMISFDDNIKFVDVSFKMESLYIAEDELEKILEEGYSGRKAKEHSLDGDGIGMWRINQMMTLNKGLFKVIRGDIYTDYQGKLYAENEFILTFPKSNSKSNSI